MICILYACVLLCHGLHSSTVASSTYTAACCLLLAVAALDDKMIDEGEHTVAVRPSDRSDPFCELASDSIRAYFRPRLVQ